MGTEIEIKSRTHQKHIGRQNRHVKQRFRDLAEITHIH